MLARRGKVTHIICVTTHEAERVRELLRQVLSPKHIGNVKVFHTKEYVRGGRPDAVGVDNILQMRRLRDLLEHVHGPELVLTVNGDLDVFTPTGFMSQLYSEAQDEKLPSAR